MAVTTPTQPLLRIEGLSKVYPKPESGGSFTVLEHISIAVRAGRSRRAPGPQRQREKHAAAASWPG